MLSPQLKRNLQRIISFGLPWLLFSFIYTFLERGLLGQLNIYPATGNPYSFGSNIILTPLIAFATGLLFGTAEVFYFNKLFAKKKLAQKIVFKTAIYVTALIVFLFSLSFISNVIEVKESIFSSQAWNNAWHFFNSYSFWSTEIYIAAMVMVGLFFHEVSDNLGQGVLINFLAGKYHSPVEEERIFMFLDMKSSTAIAEKLGHVQYFEMLKEYYADISGPIINYSGEIYQYVGDEIVISWTLQNGIHQHNCIRCFFAMKGALQLQENKYYERFGIFPQFKAGFHVGKVTTGEIGIFKKEIIFTGDVLNTTSRIQALCNTCQTDLLLSGQLVQQLSLESTYKVRPMGETELRGRDERIALFTLELTA